MTVSDATLYWQPQPDLSLYDDVLDFYDAHVYDDRPNLRNLKRALDKPYIIGEAGAAIVPEHFTDQAIEARVVESLLEQGRAEGARAVLVHSIASQNVFPASRDRLTPTGEVLSRFERTSANRTKPSVWPIVGAKLPLVSFVTADWVTSAVPRTRRSNVAGKQETWEGPLQQPWPSGP